MLPRLNIRRTYLIARRDFLGYIKTWGFWLSFMMPFIIFAFAIVIPRLGINVEPMRYEAILDETGKYEDVLKNYDLDERKNGPWHQIKKMMVDSGASAEQIAQLETLYRTQSSEDFAASIPGLSVDDLISADNAQYVPLPSRNIEELKAHILGEKTIAVDGEIEKLGSVLHIYENADGLNVDYWSDTISNVRLKSAAEAYFKTKAANDYMNSANLLIEQAGGQESQISVAGLEAAKQNAIKVKAFDPSKSFAEGQAGQAVTDNDRIPMIVAGIATVLLWLTIFSGAYMLLTSMLEEKLNKLLEMMLSTTRLSEIMIGKLAGVAALTITAMMPYILLTVGGSLFASMFLPAETATAIAQAISLKLVIFFFIFLVLGYVFYGALFIALGALAESMQDAQTLTTPIMLILSACVLVVPLGINSPDSPLLTFAAWFPLSAPFGAIARMPMDPPWWELALSALFLFILSMVVIWIAQRIFRYGVLSGAGLKGISGWIKRVIFRRN